LLRVSGQQAGKDFDLQAVLDGAVDSGVPHGKLLVEFTEAVLDDDAGRLQRARAAILSTLGPDELVDAAGAVASFNAVVKVADGTGLQVDPFRTESADALREELALGFGPKAAA
jgi:hypothetical protein